MENIFGQWESGIKSPEYNLTPCVAQELIIIVNYFPERWNTNLSGKLFFQADDKCLDHCASLLAELFLLADFNLHVIFASVSSLSDKVKTSRKASWTFPVELLSEWDPYPRPLLYYNLGHFLS